MGLQTLEKVFKGETPEWHMMTPNKEKLEETLAKANEGDEEALTWLYLWSERCLPGFHGSGNDELGIICKFISERVKRNPKVKVRIKRVVFEGWLDSSFIENRGKYYFEDDNHIEPIGTERALDEIEGLLITGFYDQEEIKVLS